MKSVQVAAVIVGLCFQHHAANSQNPSSLSNEHRDNISARFSMCSAYFNIVGAGMNKSGHSDIAKIHRELAVSLMKQSFLFAEVGRTPEMTERVVVARYGLYQSSMLDEIGKDFGNVSIIMNKFGKECALAASDQREYIRKYIDENK